MLNKILMSIQRYLLYIEYDGTRYNGWQKQTLTTNTVQENIERALFCLTQEKVEVYATGRTDAGVHAKCQVIHVEIEKQLSEKQIQNGINFYLNGEDIAVWKVEKTSLHARFDALYREYEYVITQRPSPLLKNRAWFVPKALDIEAIQAGCQILMGYHNFNAFRTVHCQAKNPNRTLDKAEVCREGALVKFRFRARSFLHNQVRIMVGTLVKGGKSDIKTILESRDRTQAGVTAPPLRIVFD